MSSSSALAVAFDTGGTFTDLALLLPDGRVLVDKVLSTPSSPAEAVLTGIDRLLEAASGAGSDLSGTRVVGATTVVTNAVLERKGASAALLVTEGFSDLLTIRDESRYDLYDLHIRFPEPLVEPELVLGVRERLTVAGDVHAELDADGLEEIAHRLREAGVQAVAVCFLHAHRFPVHEERAGALLQRLGGFDVSLSSEVSGEAREFERASTTVVNAYTRPLMRRHLDELTGEAARRGLGELSMMTSSGNVVPSAEAAEHPVRMIESGPAAGALGAGRYASLAGGRPLLAFDMGGTTAKLCVLKDGAPVIARGLEVDRQARFKEGSGIPLDIQSVKLIEIGAGGGSIAHADHLGLLAVGPQSAGAEPGPVCYGSGGTAPTVTDADLFLGLLDPDSFLGGRMRLDRQGAEGAIARLAGELDTDVTRCAWGIHELANEVMARSAAAEALESGVDPSECALVAFGGAGPTHAAGIASRLGIGTVIYPAGAGIASALGLLGAPLAYDASSTFTGALASLDPAAVRDAAESLLRRCAEALGRPIISAEFRADLRYVGQGYELTVPVPDPLAEEDFASGCETSFTAAYRNIYGRLLPGRQVEMTVLRLNAVAERPRFVGRVSREEGDRAPRTRKVTLDPERGGVEFTVLSLSSMTAGQVAHGPVIIEQAECSALVPEGRSATIAASGDIVMTTDEGVARES